MSHLVFLEAELSVLRNVRSSATTTTVLTKTKTVCRTHREADVEKDISVNVAVLIKSPPVRLLYSVYDPLVVSTCYLKLQQTR
jgi:hypothetical protein